MGQSNRKIKEQRYISVGQWEEPMGQSVGRTDESTEGTEGRTDWSTD
jgi:hypothetical protein